MYNKELVTPCLAKSCRPFGEDSCVYLCYIDPFVTLAVFVYVM